MGDGACCHYCRKYNCECPDEPWEKEFKAVEKLKEAWLETEQIMRSAQVGFEQARERRATAEDNEFRARRAYQLAKAKLEVG